MKKQPHATAIRTCQTPSVRLVPPDMAVTIAPATTSTVGPGKEVTRNNDSFRGFSVLLAQATQ